MLRRMVVFWALAAIGCESTMSVKAVTDTHAACAKRIADGTFRLERMRSVGRAPERSPEGTPVMVYGLPACKACNLAASYLEQRGIPFERRSVARPANDHAMRLVLRRAGLDVETRDLPIIDVRGVVTIGFTACAIDAAWDPPVDAGVPTDAATTPPPTETDAGVSPMDDAGAEDDGATPL